MTRVLETNHCRDRYFPLPSKGSLPPSGSTRIGVIWHLPAVAARFGLDLAELLATAGAPADVFDHPDNPIAYRTFGRLLALCEQRSGCDHFVLLLAQRSGLAELGLVGRMALCEPTVGEGLHRLASQFNLLSTSSTVSVITVGDLTRFVYAISETGIVDTRQFQVGAMAIGFNLIADLCGPEWQPVQVTFASRAPESLRPYQQFFRVPLWFDSGESAIVFERHWLVKPLAPVDPLLRKQVDADVRERQAQILSNLPAMMYSLLRKQMLLGNCSMDGIAAMLGVHRRTLDRRLKSHGMGYGTLIQDVKCDVAQQLLRDTQMSVQQIAEALRFSSAANFSTAFRRWSGLPPSEYRRAQSGRSVARRTSADPPADDA